LFNSVDGVQVGALAIHLWAIAMVVLTASVGARAVAGEEESRTLDLLLANAIPRRRS